MNMEGQSPRGRGKGFCGPIMASANRALHRLAQACHLTLDSHSLSFVAALSSCAEYVVGHARSQVLLPSVVLRS